MNDDELLARLKAADPASRTPDAPERWIKDLTEATMNDNEPTSRPTHRWGWLVAVAAGIVIAGVGGYALIGRDQPELPHTADAAPATVTRIEAPAATDAKCMVPNAKTLEGADLAFSGTVTSIKDDQVTLDVDLLYTGDATDQVEVTAPSADMQALLSAVSFKDGQRYLVAANDGKVMVCGFSAPWDQSLSAVYGQAFSG